jgi:hypothetical protein
MIKVMLDAFRRETLRNDGDIDEADINYENTDDEEINQGDVDEEEIDGREIDKGNVREEKVDKGKVDEEQDKALWRYMGFVAVFWHNRDIVSETRIKMLEEFGITREELVYHVIDKIWYPVTVSRYHRPYYLRPKMDKKLSLSWRSSSSKRSPRASPTLAYIRMESSNKNWPTSKRGLIA